MGLAVLGVQMDDAVAFVGMPTLEEGTSDEEGGPQAGDRGRGVKVTTSCLVA